jgi:prevent-host-death family protein
MHSSHTLKGPTPWRLQDAKAQFSELVDNALRGVPQHVTRRGKQAVVVLSEQDFEALRHSAGSRAKPTMNLVEHLLAMPKEPANTMRRSRSSAEVPGLELLPRDIDFS